MGTGVIALLYIIMLLIVALSESVELALYMFGFSYIFVIANNFVLGLAPAHAAVPVKKACLIKDELENSPNLVKISDDTWAPKRYTSSWWKSDWITIVVKNGVDNAMLKGRYRDLKLLSQVK